MHLGIYYQKAKFGEMSPSSPSTIWFLDTNDLKRDQQHMIFAPKDSINNDLLLRWHQRPLARHWHEQQWGGGVWGVPGPSFAPKRWLNYGI